MYLDRGDNTGFLRNAEYFNILAKKGVGGGGGHFKPLIVDMPPRKSFFAPSLTCDGADNVAGSISRPFSKP